jgi:gas vesicle protein
MKKKSGSALGGALIGAALGVVAGILLAPESGKKFRGDIGRKAAGFYAYLSPRLKKAKRMSEAEYKAFVREAAKNYGKTKRLSVHEEKAIVAHAHRSWRHLKRHLS